MDFFYIFFFFEKTETPSNLIYVWAISEQRWQIRFSYYQLWLAVCVCAGDVFIGLCVCVYKGWLWFICCVFLYGVSVGLRVNDKVWRVCDWFGQRVQIIRLLDLDKELRMKGHAHNTAHTVTLIILQICVCPGKSPFKGRFTSYGGHLGTSYVLCQEKYIFCLLERQKDQNLHCNCTF